MSADRTVMAVDVFHRGRWLRLFEGNVCMWWELPDPNPFPRLRLFRWLPG